MILNLHLRVAKLRKRLVELHKRLCDSPENCILDGGPEHMQAFELIHGRGEK